MMETIEKVLITWHDARFYPGTYKREDITVGHKMALFESMGYLISKDAQTTIIASEHNDEGEFRDVTLIPSGSIVAMGT
jgi:hypothetical protein